VTSGWIIREVSFATYKKEDEASALRLTESLKLLERGVEEWNAWRERHPDFRPYLKNANLSWTNKHIPDLSGINLSHADLDDVDLTGQALFDADLTDASLERASLVDAGLDRANLDDAKLNWADLTEAHLGFATLNGAKMTGANLSDAELWDASLQGTELSRAVLERTEASGVHAMGADLSLARLLDTDLEGADLSGADLTYATLVGTKLRNANLAGAKVYGISAWDVNVHDANQSGLVISRRDESAVLVDDIEVAQFVYLLLNHHKLRKAIGAVAERGVLVLGRFADGGREVLETVATSLRDLKYLPIIFDFDRPASRNYTETVTTLAGLSRFVIADLSGPSVPQELYATVPHFKIPFVPILETRRKAYAMSVDILEYPWVIKPVVEFESKEQLKDLVPGRIVAPAEEKHRERQLLLTKLFGSS
jgi:uncharacterized protein YjbI with pentapeptide repeats